MNTYGLSSHEYMARQFNYQQGVNLPTDHYLFNGVRSLIIPTGQRDTAVYVAPNRLVGAKFRGTREFKYWRFDLGEIVSRQYTIPPGYVPATRAQLLQFINSEYGTALTAADIIDGPITGFETPYEITFIANPTSLLYKGTFTATFIYSIEQSLPVRILDGFVYPDADGAELEFSAYSSYLTRDPNEYIQKLGQQNEELNIWLAVSDNNGGTEYTVDFGALLHNSDRISAIMNNYRITVTIDEQNDQMDRKLFLKESGPDLKGPGWYSTFNDDEISLVNTSELPTLVRGKITLPKPAGSTVVTIHAKPLRAIWLPTIQLVTTVL